MSDASSREGWFSVAYDTKDGHTDKFTWVLTFKGPEKCVSLALCIGRCGGWCSHDAGVRVWQLRGEPGQG